MAISWEKRGQQRLSERREEVEDDSSDAEGSKSGSILSASGALRARKKKSPDLTGNLMNWASSVARKGTEFVRGSRRRETACAGRKGKKGKRKGPAVSPAHSEKENLSGPRGEKERGTQSVANEGVKKEKKAHDIFPTSVLEVYHPFGVQNNIPLGRERIKLQ